MVLFSILCAACMAKLQQGMVVDLAPAETVIEAGQSRQECARLMVGENVRYAFEASAPLTVSWTTEDEGKVAKVSEVQMQSALMQRFTAEGEHNYCLNWRNGSDQAITVKYRYTPEYRVQAVGGSGGMGKPDVF
jgi:hypothetical protein